MIDVEAIKKICECEQFLLENLTRDNIPLVFDKAVVNFGSDAVFNCLVVNFLRSNAI